MFDVPEPLQSKGIDAYPVGQPPSHAISAALAEVDGTPVSVAGRVLRIRDYGGVIFAQLRDWSGEIQVLLDNSALEPGSNTGCFTAAIDLAVELLERDPAAVKAALEALTEGARARGSSSSASTRCTVSREIPHRSARARRERPAAVRCR